MNKNQKPSMSKRRATVAAVLCFVAAIAIAGTYTFNDYRKTQKNELAKAEEKAKQDSEAAKETGTSKIKNEDMTSDTDESDSNGTGKGGTTTGSGQQIPGQQIPGQPELQDPKEPEHPDHQVIPEPRQRQEKVTISTLRKTVTSCGR